MKKRSALQVSAMAAAGALLSIAHGGQAPEAKKGALSPTPPSMPASASASASKRRSIEQRVVKIVVEQFRVSKERVKRTALITSLARDSLDRVELFMAFEDEFAIEIPDSECERIRTIGEAIDYLQNSPAR